MFSGGGGGDRAIAKLTKKALNKDTQGADRMAALEKLRDIALDDRDEEASEAAMIGLYKRLELSMPDKLIDDEDEKNWAYDVCLNEVGKRGLAALERSVVDMESISWHLRLLEKLADAEEHWQVLEKIIERNEPGYERDPTRKQQLIHHLGDTKDARAAQALLQYLEDHDETVRFYTVEALFKHADEKLACEPMIKALIRPEEESRRLRNRIAEGFMDAGWSVGSSRAEVEKVLLDPFVVDPKSGKIKRKGPEQK
jgi:HEAT repeat protein